MFVLMVVRRMNLKIIVSVIVVMVVVVVFLKWLVTNLVSLVCFVTTGEKSNQLDLLKISPTEQVSLSQKSPTEREQTPVAFQTPLVGSR